MGSSGRCRGWLEKPQGLRDWGRHCFPGNPRDQNRVRQGGYQSTLAGKDDPVISFAICSSRMAPIHPLGLTSDVSYPQKVFCDPSGWDGCFLWTFRPWP